MSTMIALEDRTKNKTSMCIPQENMTEIRRDASEIDNTKNSVKCLTSVLAFSIIYGLSSTFTQIGSTYILSQITTIEKTFGLTSASSGLMVSANDIGFSVTILVASHFLQSLTRSFAGERYTVSSDKQADVVDTVPIEESDSSSIGWLYSICHLHYVVKPVPYATYFGHMYFYGRCGFSAHDGTPSRKANHNAEIFTFRFEFKHKHNFLSFVQANIQSGIE
ncbi:hypothetical protein CHS0354_031765 [Potamilus streckersoni]|uniref:Uncharacterized protein n=1 Tax=Potamilus streckersoni TaxID=2493646 RepID=A0AAE0VKB6_9BIVA|nr:hypothetical protein CHS0354_031765 [Potamilus streckersoni]